MRRTTRALKLFGYTLKYPSLVSYNKLPWELLSMDSPLVHEHAAQHYEQLVSLAARVAVPNLVVPDHLPIPQEQWMQLLPGTFYMLNAGAAAEAPALAPYGWEWRRVDDQRSRAFYGPLQGKAGSIADLVMFISPDLRVVCNCVLLDPLPGVRRGEPRSSMAAMALGPTDRIAIFHFFRPNRPPAELSRPFAKYYLQYPTATTDRFLPDAAGAWTPVLAPPKRTGPSRAAPMPFKPPTSYISGMPERAGIQPGGCFGSRALMWGHYF